MKRCTRILGAMVLGASLFGVGVWAQGSNPPNDAKPDTAAVFSSYVDGQQFDFAISHETLSSDPFWLDKNDAPPLPPRAAVRAATQLLPKLVKNADTWSLESVSLKPLLNTWIYLVTFRPPAPTGISEIIQMRMVVLMSGEAVVPTVTPWTRQ